MNKKEIIPPGSLVVEEWPLERFVPYVRNPRKNDEKTIAQMVGAIREFGFRVPVCARSDGLIVDGHLRYAAAQRLGLPTIPVALADELTDAQIKAFRLLANRSANWAEWDNELLSLELGDLKELGFDLALTGFSDIELGSLFADKTEGLTDPDDAPAVPEHPVSQTGDLWLLGRHRLLCGDCVEILPTLSGIDSFVLDPPYSSGGQFRGDRSAAPSKKYVQTGSEDTHRGEFAGDNRDQRAFLAWSSMWFGHMHRCSNQGATLCVFTDWRQLPVMSDAVQAGGWVWRNIVTWWKPGIRMQHGRFSSSAEYLLYASNGAPKAGDHSPQNVLSYSPVKGSEKQHIAEKPTALIQEILGVSPIDATVCDPFVGSGSTIIAAEMIGRAGVGIEISTGYVDVAVKRWQDFTGEKATLDGDGRTFAEIAAHRRPEQAAA